MEKATASRMNQANNKLALRGRSRTILAAVIVIGVVAFFSTLGRDSVSQFISLISDQERVSNFVLGYGLLTPIMLALLQFAQVIIAVLPGYAVSLTAGYIYGLPLGFLFNYVTVVLASQLAYGIAHKYGKPVVYRLAPSELIERWSEAAKKYGFSFFLMSFLFPVFPSDTVNYLGGLSGISGKSFLWANLLGRIPYLLLMTWLGAKGSTLATINFSTNTWIFVILGLSALYLIFTQLARQLRSALKTAS